MTNKQANFVSQGTRKREIKHKVSRRMIITKILAEMKELEIRKKQ